MTGFFGLIFIILSFMGFSSYVKERFLLNNYFIPFVLATTYILTIYIAALFSFMKIWVYGVNILGIVILFTYKSKKHIIKSLFPSYYLFFIGLIVFTIYLYNKKSFWYDDYSHWGVISRLLLEKDSLNTAPDFTIDFKSYPQASAYFLYGIGKFVGYSEGKLFIANTMLMYSACFCFFYCLRGKNFIYGFLIVAFALFYNTRPYTLYVDSLLSVFAFAIFAFYLYLRENKKLGIFTVPMFASLVLLKNSGLMLAIFLIIFYIFYERKKALVLACYDLLAVLISYLSWNLHVKNEFGTLSKHQMSISAYSKELHSKDMEVVNKISSLFAKAIISDWFIIVFLIILVLIYFIYNKDKKIHEVRIRSLIVYGFYAVGLYLMYLFSMPTHEALWLASFDRYIRTIHILIFMSALYYLFLNFDNQRLLGLIFSLVCVFTLVKAQPIGIIAPRNVEVREIFDREKIKLGDVSGKNILVVFKHQDQSRYYTRMAMFVFDKAHITDSFRGDSRQFNKEDFDYIIEE